MTAQPTEAQGQRIPLTKEGLHTVMTGLATCVEGTFADSELTVPILHTVDASGQQMRMYFLEGVSSEKVAYYSRLLAAADDAEMVVLAIEAHIGKMPMDAAVPDPDFEAIKAGAMRVSELPAHKRGEAMMLFGEMFTGETITRMWEIAPAPAPGEPRVYTEMTEFGASSVLSSRFEDLFLARTAARKFGGTLAEHRAQAQRTARRILADEGMVLDTVASTDAEDA